MNAEMFQPPNFEPARSDTKVMADGVKLQGSIDPELPVQVPNCTVAGSSAAVGLSFLVSCSTSSRAKESRPPKALNLYSAPNVSVHGAGGVPLSPVMESPFATIGVVERGPANEFAV